LFYWYKSTNTDAAAASDEAASCFTGTKVGILTLLAASDEPRGGE
jgi:hypothetical protein